MDIMGSELLRDCNTFNRAANFMMKNWLLAQNVCKLSMFWHWCDSHLQWEVWIISYFSITKKDHWTILSTDT